jgi:hypothetical protein
MKTNIRLAKFLKVVLDILFGSLIFITVLLILWITIFPLLLQRGILGTASIPVGIGSGSEPSFSVSFENSPKEDVHNAFVDEAGGVLRLETTSWYLIFISNAAKLVTAVGLTYFFNLLRKVLRSIMNGTPFESSNAIRIRRIGYLILILGFVIPTTDYIAANEILHRLRGTLPELTVPSPFKAEIILVSLLVLLLAQVWSYGVEIERDRALTI